MKTAKAEKLTVQSSDQRKSKLRRLEQKGVEYLALKAQDKANTEHESAIKEEVLPMVEEYGEFESEESDNKVLDCGSILFKKEVRTQVKIAPEAEERLRELNLWEEATSREIDPNKLRALVASKKLKPSDLKMMLHDNKTVAFIVRKK